MWALQLIVLAMAQSADPSADELRRRAVENRQKIQTAHATLRIVETTYNAKGDSSDDVYSITIWQTADRSRIDTVKEGRADSLTGQGLRSSICQIFDQRDYLAVYGEGGRGLYIYLPSDNQYPPNLDSIVDIRDIGSVWDNIRMAKINRKSFRSQIISENRVLTGKPTEEIFEGLLSYRLDFILKTTGALSTAWFIPDRGGSVGKYYGRTAPSAKDRIEGRCTSKFFPAAINGIWFPREVLFERSTNGKPTFKQSITVISIALNDPINPEVFSVKGMNILPGTPVIAPWLPKWLTDGKGRVYEWQNGKIGSRDARDLPYGVDPANVASPESIPQPVPVNAPSNANNIWRIVGIVAFSLVSGLFVVKYLRSRKRD